MTLRRGNASMTLRRGNANMTLRRGNASMTLRRGNASMTLRRGNATGEERQHGDLRTMSRGVSLIGMVQPLRSSSLGMAVSQNTATVGPVPVGPEAAIMVGLTDDLPILLETGLDGPSRFLLPCLGRDLESPRDTRRQTEVNRLLSSSNGLVGVRDLIDTFCMEPWVEEELLSLTPPSLDLCEDEEEEERGILPPAIRASYGGGLFKLRGVRERPMLTGEGHADWLRG
ncbi:hypothetical protein EYF80_055799 [Liparis tanakae]|uniref:Uncharacterized protein n=1 Tax=Liparis tanakae TaxID=230148 RepID=A0A4Z2EYS0_9TELE|nr:hypothetical protein EYF80_055799 [Liparis tanakae]